MGLQVRSGKDEAEFDDERMVLAGEAPVQPQRLSEDLLTVIETVLLRCAFVPLDSVHHFCGAPIYVSR